MQNIVRTTILRLNGFVSTGETGPEIFSNLLKPRFYAGKHVINNQQHTSQTFETSNNAIAKVVHFKGTFTPQFPQRVLVELTRR